MAILDKTPQELVITELNLPDVSGLELLQRIRMEHHETAVIVMAEFGTVQTAVDAMKAGAYDYLTKPNQGRVAGQRRTARLLPLRENGGERDTPRGQSLQSLRETLSNRRTTGGRA
jgi:DNA-binding NtrC family response regulator